MGASQGDELLQRSTPRRGDVFGQRETALSVGVKGLEDDRALVTWYCTVVALRSQPGLEQINVSNSSYETSGGLLRNRPNLKTSSNDAEMVFSPLFAHFRVRLYREIHC